MKDGKLTRRAFLAATTTTAIITGCAAKGPTLNVARVVPRRLSPNEKLNIAGIGVGGMGHADIMSCRSENIVALCDVDWKRAEEAFYRLPDAAKYKDFRKMFDRMDKDIDAVVISTPDHSHAPAAYWAMMLGKHLRVQKPLTQTIAEARLLTRLAQENPKLVTAMGNQGHAEDGVRELCEMMWSGVIGPVTEAHCWTDRPIWPQGLERRARGRAVPEHLDWDLWLGPAPRREYSEAYVPFRWRGWWDFGCGAIGDMACHIMDPVFWSLHLIEAPTFTVQTVSQEGMTRQTGPLKSVIRYEFPARGDMGPVVVYWYDGGNLPPRPAGIPADQKLGDGENGSMFIGATGVLTAGEYGGNPRLMPDEVMIDYTKPAPHIPRIPGENPYRNWLDGIRSGERPASHFGYAGRLTEVANVGNVALHAGDKKLEMDVATCAITNDAAANALLTKEYRQGWELPC